MPLCNFIAKHQSKCTPAVFCSPARAKLEKLQLADTLFAGRAVFPNVVKALSMADFFEMTFLFRSST
jgi:hypothetical protein